jgi:hypothetical protein
MTTATNGRRITTHEATVKTAAVEVKTLTISGKQVTLAVFRQLKEEALIDPQTLEYRGIPWGLVNYFWGECTIPGERGHLHVVWQKGEDLRRCCVEERPFRTVTWINERQGQAITRQYGKVFFADPHVGPRYEALWTVILNKRRFCLPYKISLME